MSLATPDYCEAPVAESREEMGADTQDHDILAPPDAQPESEPEPEPEADAQILEALRSAKDRLFVLKLGESMESLILERQYVVVSLIIPLCSIYLATLAHEIE